MHVAGGKTQGRCGNINGASAYRLQVIIHRSKISPTVNPLFTADVRGTSRGCRCTTRRIRCTGHCEWWQRHDCGGGPVRYKWRYDDSASCHRYTHLLSLSNASHCISASRVSVIRQSKRIISTGRRRRAWTFIIILSSSGSNVHATAASREESAFVCLHPRDECTARTDDDRAAKTPPLKTDKTLICGQIVWRRRRYCYTRRRW